MPISEHIDKIRKDIEEKEKVQVRIALFGKSGVGKSTLINKLTGQKLAREGVKTDTTTEAHEFEWNGLYLVDLPGYGTMKYSAEEYVQRFNILDFDVFLCVLTDRIMSDDVKQFELLKKYNKTCIFVRNKHDQIWQEDRDIKELEAEIREDLKEQAGTDQKLYFVSCRTGYGLDDLENAIYSSLDAAKKERWVTAAKAYSESFLEQKKRACRDLVKGYAALAAANGLNPIPGLDIAVDISLLLKLFSQIKSSFGLQDNLLKNKEFLIPAGAQLTRNIIEYATKEGITVLLKRFSTSIGAKEIGKFIPFVGQAIAASAGFAITYQAGNAYLEDCYKMADGILRQELGM